MRTTILVVLIAIGGIAVGAAVGREIGQPAPPPQMPAGMPNGMTGMMPQMMGMGMDPMMGGGSMAVSPDRTVYVLRAATLYRYSPELKLLNEVQVTPTRPPHSSAR